MTSIQLTVSSLSRRINDRIRIAPTQLFQSMDCLWLVLFDDLLLCPETGRQLRLDVGAAELHEAQDFGRLAAAARELCAGRDRPLGLALPLSRFLYSHYSVQLGNEYLNDRDMVHSAIALQKDLLLPAFEQEFALSAAVGRPEGVAFWLPQQTLRHIEAAFEAAGLELIGVLPRPLAVVPAGGKTGDLVLADQDSSCVSVVEIERGICTRVLSAFRQEFDNQDIRNAWDEQAAPLLEASPGPLVMSSADDWLGLKDMQQVLKDYLLFTQEFLQTLGGRNRQRRIWAAGAVAAAAVLVLSLPFIYQWTDTLRLERARDAYREQARVAQAYENEILDMEYEWGIVYEYPEADVPGILMGLNSVIDNSLTSLSLSDSTVEIQGFTEDPEKLTKLLLEQPMFERIEQSRSISESNTGSGDRFGLRLILSGHDYPEYARKYDFK